MLGHAEILNLLFNRFQEAFNEAYQLAAHLLAVSSFNASSVSKCHLFTKSVEATAVPSPLIDDVVVQAIFKSSKILLALDDIALCI